ncbi:MAG TPA: hypothetical protein VM100_10905 [Longimicrobiales bacterium]|nr:hypothetical protein [Longimicrobiales bacterium]
MNKPRPTIAGVEVREDDLDRKPGLHIAAIVIRVSSIVILLLALWQFYAWFKDQPPGGAGLGLLVGDTIRLIVFAALLWAASEIADLWIKTHYDVRAGRILLARQTYMIRQWGLAAGTIPPHEAPQEERRGVEPEATVDPGAAD